MDIKAILTARPSKSEMMEIVDYVDSHPESMSQLMDCYLSDDLLSSQWASWPVGYLGRLRPDLIRPYLKSIVEKMDHPLHPAFTRGALRVFEEIPIPEELDGLLYDKCTKYISNTKLPTAIRAFSLTVAFRIVEKYPELVHEYHDLVQSYFETGTVGFQNRAGKILAKLRKFAS